MSDLQTSTTGPAPTIDTQLCFALHSASNAIDQMYRPLLEEHDLTYAQYITLMALAEQDDVSITALALRLQVSKATMTPLLRRLEAKSLLTRHLKTDNERQKSVRITALGRAVFDQSGPSSETVFSALGLTQEQAASMVQMCKVITKR